MDDKVTSSESKKAISCDYYSTLPVDAKTRYTSKLQYDFGTKSLPDPYSLTEKWCTDPNTWPDLTFGDIYLYLVDTPSIYTKESMKAYKSLDAYRYVVSGHVQVVLSHKISDDCPYVALKTKVTPSQRSRDKPHQPWVYLEKTTGTVYCAHCTCMAGLGEVCSHVGALLFKVEMGVKIGMTKTSSTSAACQWNSKFRKEVQPATITEIYDQIKGKRKKDVANVQANGSTPLPSLFDLQQLYAVAPNAVFFTSVIIPGVNDNVPSAKKPEPTDKYPKLLTSLHQPDVEPDNKVIEDTCTNYAITDMQAANLESATRNQSVSPLWYEHRNGRVTASKAHDVLRLRETTSPDNIVRRICGYNTYDLSTKEAVRWGIEHEDEARNAYDKHMNSSHINFKCQQSGFVVHPKHPFVGASPDGVISCDCCGNGTLEIKCPYKYRDTPVEDIPTKDNNFCLDKSLQLKSSHRYYTQVQLQMYLTNCAYSDFVVYSKCHPPSMIIARINIDMNFCKHLVNVCESFVREHVIYELITQKLKSLPSSKPPATVTNNNEQRDTWCLCAEPEYGRMIRCDGADCPYEWFHYKCVNIRRKPRGVWYCASCEL